MRWPPFDHVIFDCDSTLSTVEGIDILAERHGVGGAVVDLTNRAMDGEVELSSVYGDRLRLINPTRGDIRAIRTAYRQNVTEGVVDLLGALKTLGHRVYIVSGGLEDPVREFGMSLGIPKEHVFAVGVDYDRLGGDGWWSADGVAGDWQHRLIGHRSGPLAESRGKADLIREEFATRPGRRLLVGDGVSDLNAGEAVDLFVGFAGVVSRPRVVESAPVVINGPSLLPLLAIAAGPWRVGRELGAAQAAVAARALSADSVAALGFNDEKLRARFVRALADSAA